MSLHNRRLFLVLSPIFLVPALSGQSNNPPKFIDGYCDCSTPLSIAIDRNDAESVKVLVAKGEDVSTKYYDRHLRGDLPGRTTLDLAQLNLRHRSAAAKGSPSVETRTQLDRACSIYTLLKQHGAIESRVGEADGSGDPACNATEAEKASAMAVLEKQDADKDQLTRSRDQENALHLCSTNAMGSFYNCSCFAQKVSGYRILHGTKEPFTNILSKVDYSSCLGPSEPMVKYATDRASATLKSSRLDPATKDQVAACIGPDVAATYRARASSLPQFKISLVDGIFLQAYTACSEKFRR